MSLIGIDYFMLRLSTGAGVPHVVENGERRVRMGKDILMMGAILDFGSEGKSRSGLA
jgi:hypothetical protein